MAQLTARQQRKAILDAIEASERARNSRLDDIDERLGALGRAVKDNTDTLRLYGQSIAVLDTHREAMSKRGDKQNGRLDKVEDRVQKAAVQQAKIGGLTGLLAGLGGTGLWQFLSQLMSR